MLYVKNVPDWERVARVLLGIAVGAAGVAQFGATATGYAAGGVGAMIALTGFVGFCPACALVGRKLAK